MMIRKMLVLSISTVLEIMSLKSQNFKVKSKICVITVKVMIKKGKVVSEKV